MCALVRGLPRRVDKHQPASLKSTWACRAAVSTVQADTPKPDVPQQQQKNRTEQQPIQRASGTVTGAARGG